MQNDNKHRQDIFYRAALLGAVVVKLVRERKCLGMGPVLATALTLLALTAPGPSPLIAETDPMDAPMQVVRFGETDNIRDVVGQHLGDPDLWPTVLRLNRIASPADLRPGAELQLPVRQVAAADQALLTSLTAIQKANAEGARIFAPTQIGSAIENRDTAIMRREEGEWRQVVDHAGLATEFAHEALDISLAQRDRAAEAVVSDVQGRVEGRAPAEPQWSGRDLDDILVEFERLRTLSSSTAQVTFRDLSRLRLNPNSNATIQRMRSDPLTGGEVTRVSLAEGDFYALLNQLSDRTTFEIDVPGIESTTNSADFWIKSDKTGARFVNYDDAGLEVASAEGKVQLGKGEGLVVTDAGTTRAGVLASPLPTMPPTGAVIYTTSADLGWDPFEGAEGYWLEIAADPAFNHMQVSEWGIRGTGYVAENLAPARYHWRVAALDRLGLPGQWSTPRDFTIRLDDTPPYLTLLSPGSGVIATRPEIEVLGATEGDATLTLNGAPLDIGGDGSFLTVVALAPGDNTLTVRATDPAGNVTERSQTVTYRPAVQIAITLSEAIPRVDGALATRSAELSVFGTTTAQPGAAAVVRDGSGAEIVRTQVAADGGLQFTVPADEDGRDYVIEVLSPGGEIEGAARFSALRDREPPVVALDAPPPKATAERQLRLSGDAGDAVTVDLDGTSVPLSGGRFDLALTLEPGTNGFDLVATDAVGNVTATRVATLLDIDPPVVLDKRLERPEGDGGPIVIEVRAEDESGLRQAASFVIAVGGAERDGFLRCDAASGLCRASLPPEPGDLEFIEVAIEDYAGNVAFD